MKGVQINIADIYPKARDCVNGHIGRPEDTFYWEYDDDRGWLLIVERCGHCGIPLGDRYATDKEIEEYYERQAGIAI